MYIYIPYKGHHIISCAILLLFLSYPVLPYFRAVVSHSLSYGTVYFIVCYGAVSCCIVSYPVVDYRIVACSIISCHILSFPVQ